MAQRLVTDSIQWIPEGRAFRRVGAPTQGASWAPMGDENQGHPWTPRVTTEHQGITYPTYGIMGSRILKSSFACLFYDLPLVAALSIMTTRRNYSCYVLLQINSPPDPLQIIGLLGRGAQSSYCGSSWGRFSDPLQSQSSCNSHRFC